MGGPALVQTTYIYKRVAYNKGTEYLYFTHRDSVPLRLTDQA